jgi:predicted RNA-binding Zn ribbon-like protein
VSRHVAEASARTVVTRGPEGYRLDRALAGALRAPLWRVASSMEDLLTTDELARVRRCGAWERADDGRCAWLFLDETRNHSRRWCSMAVCGNRMKARRHYQRVGGRRSGSA